MVNTKPRLAFAGVGWIGRNRMEAALKSGLANIVAVSDPSVECRSEASKLARNVMLTTSFEDLIDQPEVDAVVIATPSALHSQQSLMALERGKAVFCQKPLGRNGEEVRQMVRAAMKADKLLGADFSYRHTSAFRAIREVVRSGELGKIYAVDLKFHNAYGPDKPWFYDITQSGGGCVLDLGIHLIDLMQNALGCPDVKPLSSSLYSRGEKIRTRNIVEDFANVVLEVEDDIRAQLSCSWNLHAGCEAVIEASFYGTHGGVAMKNINGSFYDFTAYKYTGTNSEVIAAPPDAWGGRAIVEWLRRLTVDPGFNSEASEFISSAQIIDRIYDAAE